MFTQAGNRAGNHSFYLRYWGEAEAALVAPNLAVPVHSFSAIQPSFALFNNIDAAIVPKGTGAFLGAVPDNTAVGGNKRGNYAVDLQFQRTTNTMVAGANNSSLIAGRNNSIIPTGAANLPYAGIFCGITNVIQGAGNGTGHAIVGGSNHTINDASGLGGGFIGGGASMTLTTASGKDYQFSVGSFSGTVTGQYAGAIGGREHSSVSDAGVCFAWQAKTRGCIGQMAIGANSGGAGLAQMGIYQLAATTNDAVTGKVLSQVRSSGVASTTTQVGVLPTGYAFTFWGIVTATIGASASSTGSWIVMGMVKNFAGTVSVPAGSSVTTIQLEAGLAGATVTISGDNVNKCLTLTVNGIAATTVDWHAFVLTSEVN